MSINVITPSYNGFALIEKNLPKALSVISKYDNVTVTVVDDGSDKEEKV